MSERKSELNQDSLIRGYNRLPSVLAQMGYPSLRQGQDPPIMNLMGQRDTICILPTSLGKTAVFVIPTLCLDWKTIVFSPLVALMRDQVQGLWKQGIKAACMSGMQTDAENAQAIRQWMSGELQFLYVAPERLRNEAFIEATRVQCPDFVVMDEAHTISAWSDNFRSAYCAIGPFIAHKQPKVVLACTATCPDEVEGDIRRVMGIPCADKILYYPRRDNLLLQSAAYPGDAALAAMLKRSPGTSLVYAATIKTVEELAASLSNFLNEEVGFFHGQLPPEAKRSAQDLWMKNKVRHMVATNAFGMGIDKPDVRTVVHRNHPGSLEALSQETGRAGRDGNQSVCMTFFDDSSYRTQLFFLECGHPDRKDIEAVYNVVSQHSGPSGEIQMSLKEIGQQGGVSPMVVGASIQILVGSAVIERFSAEQKMLKFRFTGSKEDNTFNTYKDAIEDLGVMIGTTGFMEVDQQALVDKIGRSWPTVSRYIKQWEREGVLAWEPPFRGSNTRLIGDLDLVDFGRLKIRRDEAYAKLEQVRQYASIPDKLKHKYLEEYFGVPSND